MKCQKCDTKMEVLIETDRDKDLIRRYLRYSCPKCGHITYREEGVNVKSDIA